MIYSYQRSGFLCTARDCVEWTVAFRGQLRPAAQSVPGRMTSTTVGSLMSPLCPEKQMKEKAKVPTQETLGGEIALKEDRR